MFILSNFDVLVGKFVILPRCCDCLLNLVVRGFIFCVGL
ncbi:Hypothetical protein Cp262_1404 [Corynebacterium pseudotuberculosis]|nr:Hypothetical protein Cp262_1404 [Corynebacterium pseudotuberculosis]